MNSSHLILAPQNNLSFLCLCSEQFFKENLRNILGDTASPDNKHTIWLSRIDEESRFAPKSVDSPSILEMSTSDSFARGWGAVRVTRPHYDTVPVIYVKSLGIFTGHRQY